jgi:sterol desaturase/sphingolipid hydroxylase (fatty acid hydroxylase superfamily)
MLRISLGIMELAIAIAANVVIGVVLLALFAWYRTPDAVRLTGPEEALAFFWGTLSWILLGVVAIVYRHRLLDVPFTWWTFLLAFVLEDLRYYWWHRISHRSRWFWASHVVHHSSQHFNLSTNLRQSWTSQFSGLILMNVPLAYIGFSPAMVGLAFSLNLLYQFWIHTESVGRMPFWFEWLLNTPSHHRVHHARTLEVCERFLMAARRRGVPPC